MPYRKILSQNKTENKDRFPYMVEPPRSILGGGFFCAKIDILFFSLYILFL